MKNLLSIFLLMLFCLPLQAQEDSILVFKVRKPPPNIVEVRLQLLNTLRVNRSGNLPQFYNGLSGLEEFFEVNVPYAVYEGEERAQVTFRLSNNGQTFSVSTDSVTATTDELSLAVKDAMANMPDWSGDCYGGVDNLAFTMDVIFKPWQEKSSQTELKQVMKPFPGAHQKPHKRFTFKAEDGFFHHFPNGTHIIIPPNAFVNAAGNIVTGKVEITYRDFHTVQELMANGITTGMVVQAVDSSKYIIPFQSGGVVEFRAYQNKQELQLAKDKNVLLETISNFTEIDIEVQHWNPEAGNWLEAGRETTGIPYAIDTFSTKRVKLEKVKYSKRDTLLIVELNIFRDKVKMPDARMLQRYYWKVPVEDATVVNEMLRKKRIPSQPKNFLSFTWLLPKRSQDQFADVQWVYDERQRKMSLIFNEGFNHEQRVLAVQPVKKHNLDIYNKINAFSRYYARYVERYQMRKTRESTEKFHFFAERKNFTSAAEKFATSRGTVIPPKYRDSLVRSFFVDSTGLFMCANQPLWSNSIAGVARNNQSQNFPARFADERYKEILPEAVYLVLHNFRSAIIFDPENGIVPLFIQSRNFINQTLLAPVDGGNTVYFNRSGFCTPPGFISFDIFVGRAESGNIIFPVAGNE